MAKIFFPILLIIFYTTKIKSQDNSDQSKNEIIEIDVFPTLNSLDEIEYNSNKDIFYYLVTEKDLTNNQSFKCLPKIKGNNNADLETYALEDTKIFSRPNEEGYDLYNSSSSKISFSTPMNYMFGPYKCESKDNLQNYKIVNKEVYFLPDNNTQILLESSTFNKYYGPSCFEVYENYSKIYQMVVIFPGANQKTIIINNISKLREEQQNKDNNELIYDIGDISFDVEVICKYNTTLETVYETKQFFEYTKKRVRRNSTGVVKNDTSKDSNDWKNSQNSGSSDTSQILWVVAFVGIVLVFSIAVIIIVYIFRKVKKIREKRRLSKLASLSKFPSASNKSSTNRSKNSSATSKTTSKGSQSKVSKGQKSSTDKQSAITSKVNDNGSGTGDTNKSSTNNGVNYYRDVKLTAI